MRVGIGYDVHRLGENRKLILGGVTIPYELGLIGHSDADVLTHAICDAMLGAAGLGDIGQHFPDTDAAYAGIDSLILLGRGEGVNFCRLRNSERGQHGDYATPKTGPLYPFHASTPCRDTRYFKQSGECQSDHLGRTRFHWRRQSRCR